MNEHQRESRLPDWCPLPMEGADQTRRRSRLKVTRRQMLGQLVAVGLLAACTPAAPATTPKPAESKPADAKPTAAAPSGASQPAAAATAAPAPAAQAPAAAAAPASAKDGGSVSIALFTAPGPMLPQYTSTNQARFITRLIFGALLEYDEKLEIKPGLAEKWSVSQDQKTYTFNLRKDVKWHDGKPFTARDVEYTVLNMTDKASTNNWFIYVDPILGAKERKAGKADALPSVKVVDDYTIQVTTEAPSGPFLENFGINLRVFPRHILESVPIADLPKHPFMTAPNVGVGPYKFVRNETDQYVELERNPEFYGGAPKIGRVFVKVLKPDAALAQLEKGELDMVAAEGLGDVPATEVERLQKIQSLTVQSYPGTVLVNMGFNHKLPKWQNQKVRQAVATATNREVMVKDLLLGRGKLAIGTIPEDSPYFLKDQDPYAYNPDKAKALLKEGGWDAATEVVLYVPTSNRTRELPGQVILQNLQDIGMKVTIRQLDLATMVAAGRKAELDLFVSGNAEFIDPDLTRRFHSSMTTAGANLGHYMNPEADRLLEKGAQTVGLEARRPIYNDLQKLMNQDLPILPLVRADHIGAVNKRVQGVKYSTVGILTNVTQWTVGG